VSVASGSGSTQHPSTRESVAERDLEFEGVDRVVQDQPAGSICGC
jgi:hypothetical protein